MSETQDEKQTAKPEPVRFDDRQKTTIKQMVVDRLTREKKAHQKELAALQTEAGRVKAENETLRKQLAALDPEHNNDSSDTELGSSQESKPQDAERKTAGGQPVITWSPDAYQAEVIKLKRQVFSEKCDKEVRLAMSTIDWQDSEQVRQLCESRIKWVKEIGRFAATNADGSIVQNPQTLAPMMLEEFFSDFATKSPHLVRGQCASGANSTQTLGQPAARIIEAKADFRSDAEKREFITRHGLDQSNACRCGEDKTCVRIRNTLARNPDQSGSQSSRPERLSKKCTLLGRDHGLKTVVRTGAV